MLGNIKLYTNAIGLARFFQGDIVRAQVQNIWRSIRARKVQFHLFDIVDVTIGRVDGFRAPKDEGRPVFAAALERQRAEVVFAIQPSAGEATSCVLK